MIMQEDREKYALALLAEECGEVVQLVGKAFRFGIDTPGVKDASTGHVDLTVTARTMIEKECGDLLAAIEYAADRGLISLHATLTHKKRKYDKLFDPSAKDNLGRRLAP